MNKLFKTFSIIAAITIVALAFGAHVREGEAAPNSLPFNLEMQDTMAAVEQKFGQPMVAGIPQAGWEAGLPDEGGSPDHVHYWAVYKRFGVTVVYNSPFASDKNATIHAILVNK